MTIDVMKTGLIEQEDLVEQVGGAWQLSSRGPTSLNSHMTVELYRELSLPPEDDSVAGAARVQSSL
jgi:hypothetical protein